MRLPLILALAALLPAQALAQPGFAQGQSGASQSGVSITGDARMGVAYDGGSEGGMRFVSRMRVHFHFRGQTDGGLGYGVGLGDGDRADPATRGQGGTLQFGSALPPELRRPQPLRWSGE
ncbi:porin [Alkalilacustris brevis]|uniref:porin n=1 Tax=Alkalilacustris brevis TaxID=2026338 RepID=UPI0013903DA5|nr:porin [Alkalilacustris brevis]